ncbi:MAG: amidohydrolase [Steroidobacteraceae bacterium]|nr:amidohydrolase [Steroidobacteraceae bacterium]
MPFRPVSSALAVAMVLLAFAPPALAKPPPTLAVTNARVWTADSDRPWAEAVAMRDDVIVAVGTTEEIAALSPARTLDAGGRLVLPGFIDSHVHFAGGSLGLSQVDLTGACSVPEMQSRIAAWAKANPDAPWIQGGGWEYTCFPGGRLPTREELDPVTDSRPAYLRAYDGHSAWANTRALEVAGVDRGTTFTGFGELVKDPGTGEPTGALKEGAMRLVSSHLPATTREERLAAIRQGLRAAAGLGITSLHNASGSVEEVGLYEELIAGDELTARMVFAMSAGRDPDPCAAWQALREKHSGPWLRVPAVKFMVDGVIESHTAAMLEPYSDKPDERGQFALDRETYSKALAGCAALGFQPWTHAIGDAGVRLALDAYDTLDRPDLRPRVEHIEVISIADLPRFRQVGVIASMQPIHAYPSTVAVWSRAVGEARLPRAFPWRSLQSAGARLTFSSDWPASISLSPMRGLHNAVNRRTVEGDPPGGWLPQQRVDLETALRAYTIDAAWAVRLEDERGSLTPGKLADLVVLDRDLFATDPQEIHEAQVVTTIVGGRVVYARE